ncbi:putative ATP-dependent Clp protease proteolytic subunit [Klebsiella phage vB_KleM_RaK2]|uniref:Putative ATP-dependent Clp protease proteolytic subunit n=2 Tax=Alcyoneusvirus TaxID=2560086 RepID=H6X4U6_9CAUD|nr:head maturation protease [Klebsiella phage vB_KleM_RaK2]AFA44762.1 putative ATP-dependent Clp protease proteolytic subunit [Klebsiella phage vB_KleM_RaK2]
MLQCLYKLINKHEEIQMLDQFTFGGYSSGTQITNYSVPIVVEKENGQERSYDLSSRMMKERIIFIDSDFNPQMAHILKMQLLWLDSQDDAPIVLYVSSPGGSVHDGLGIADVAKYCRSPIRTIVMGYAASMGAFTQSTVGTPGHRFAGESAMIMCHQVSSGTKGLITDQKIALKHTERLNELLMKRIAESVGVSYEQLLEDADRDLWLNAEESLNYGTKGFIDGIILSAKNEKGEFLVRRRGGVEEWVK